jgi:predicted nucleotidyltransferase
MTPLSPRVRAALDEFVGRLRAELGGRVHRLILFGSVARGQARWDSDIDVLVVLEGEVDRPTWVRIVDWGSSAIERHGVVISPTVLSRAGFEQMVAHGRRLVRDALQEGIPL